MNFQGLPTQILPFLADRLGSQSNPDSPSGLEIFHEMSLSKN